MGETVVFLKMLIGLEIWLVFFSYLHKKVTLVRIVTLFSQKGDRRFGLLLKSTKPITHTAVIDAAGFECSRHSRWQSVYDLFLSIRSFCIILSSERARRKPLLLFLLSGLLLSRFDERQLLASLFQLPPRFTRLDPLCDCHRFVSSCMPRGISDSQHARQRLTGGVYAQHIAPDSTCRSQEILHRLIVSSWSVSYFCLTTNSGKAESCIQGRPVPPSISGKPEAWT